jgi:hypothetical protein
MKVKLGTGYLHRNRVVIACPGQVRAVIKIEVVTVHFQESIRVVRLSTEKIVFIG